MFYAVENGKFEILYSNFPTERDIFFTFQAKSMTYVNWARRSSIIFNTVYWHSWIVHIDEEFPFSEYSSRDMLSLSLPLQSMAHCFHLLFGVIKFFYHRFRSPIDLWSVRFHSTHSNGIFSNFLILAHMTPTHQVLHWKIFFALFHEVKSDFNSFNCFEVLVLGLRFT